MQAAIWAVTSLHGGTGTSTVALCLARALMENGDDCLLIDRARGPGVTHLLGVPRTAQPKANGAGVQVAGLELWPQGWDPPSGVFFEPLTRTLVVDATNDDPVVQFAHELVIVFGSQRSDDFSGFAVDQLERNRSPRCRMTVVPVAQQSSPGPIATKARAIARSFKNSRTAQALPFVAGLECPLPQTPAPFQPAIRKLRSMLCDRTPESSSAKR